jgi:hypothetical protein
MAHRITFTCNDQLFAELERLSMIDGRSLSNLVAVGIELYVEERNAADAAQMCDSPQAGPNW